MAESFDPYEQWLGIAPDEHPVDHYRMLGVPRFERDLQKIADAADERMKMMRSFQTGRRGQFTHRILNELSSAKICLLNPGSKATYDAVLEGQLAASLNKNSASMPRSASAMLPPTAEMPQPSGGSNPSPPVIPTTMPPQAYAASVYSPSNPVPGYGVQYGTQPPAAMPYTQPYAPPVSPAPPPFDVNSFAPAPIAPPMSIEPAAPTGPPPSFTLAPPPVSKSANPPKRAPPSSKLVPVSQPNESAKSNESTEEQVSLMARPWFPVAVFGAIGALVGCVVLIRSWQHSPSHPKVNATNASATTEPVPVQEKSTVSTEKPPHRPSTEVMIHQEGDGGVNFPPQLAVIHGQKAELQTRNEEYEIGHWTSSEDTMTWRFHLVKPQHFRAQITYSAAEDAAGGRFAILVDDDERQGDVRPSESSGKFHTDEFFVSVKRAGDHRLTLRAINKPGVEFMTFKFLRFTPYNASREKPKAE